MSDEIVARQRSLKAQLDSFLHYNPIIDNPKTQHDIDQKAARIKFVGEIYRQYGRLQIMLERDAAQSAPDGGAAQGAEPGVQGADNG